MLFIIGLGNPTQEYELTRHNIGWMFVEYLRRQLNLEEFKSQKKWNAEVSKNADICLIKPLTFMNRSGEAVRSIIQFYDQLQLQHSTLDQVIVVHDDLDLEQGTFKIQFGRGPKVHNGVNSIRTHLKTSEFWYVRVGIDGRAGDRSVPGHAYVLQRFSSSDIQVFESVFAQMYERLLEQIAVH